jgi:predicted ATPase with chaperone activity
MRLSKQPFAMAALAAAWLLVAPGANAQNQPASPKQSTSPNIPDQKLDAAAAAIDRVASVKQNYQQKIATAAPSDKDRLAGDANNAMKKAVTDQGLSVEEYSSILRVAQNDPGVRDRLLQRLHSPTQ